MRSFLQALRRPGAMVDVVVAAPSYIPEDASLKDELRTSIEVIRECPGYTPEAKPRFLDRALDRAVRASGSVTMFCLLQVLLWGWAFSGIVVYNSYLWPVVMSDVQAIFSYLFDSLLMRQQLNGYSENLHVAAELQSRSASHRRMLKQVVQGVSADDLVKAAGATSNDRFADMRLPEQSKFDRIIDKMGVVLGHIGFVVFFWAAMFLWLGFGPLNQWSNQWQLDINSATSGLMIFIFSFLAILRERHADYIRACLDSIYRVDFALEKKLRVLTDDHLPHPEFLIRAPKVSGLQRAINYYANVVGTLVGVALLVIVIIVWIAIGPALQFSTNWWLLIGTYSGLVGLNDGFVMRNVQAKLREHEAPQYVEIDAGDRMLLETVNMVPKTATPVDTTKISYRISEKMNKICGHEATVLLGFLLICGLLAGSSVMQWNETGQLLSNIPPSIVESFFMIILITGHNAADAHRRKDLTNMFRRRLQLVDFVDQLDASHVKVAPPSEKTFTFSAPVTEVKGEDV